MKILLFGATGMLGRYVLRILNKTYEVICVLRDDYDIEKDSWAKLEDTLTTKLQKNDVIINCAGVIPQKYKDDNYMTYIRVNTLFPHKLNEMSKNNSYKFIHITTDCVYDGSRGNYCLIDDHTAKNIYGISKSLGEPAEATLIRSSIIGEELVGKKSLLEWVKSNKNGKLNGYTNHYWNGITCLELAKIIKHTIDNNSFWQGVKNIASLEIVTKYELCNYINEIYNLNINIEKYNDFVSKNMTISGDKTFKLNNIYQQLVEQYNFGL